MNQSQLIAAVADIAAVPRRDVEHVLKTTAQVIHDTLAHGQDLSLPGIGKFGTQLRAPRTGRNPATGAPLAIPARLVPTFTAAKALKDAVSLT